MCMWLPRKLSASVRHLLSIRRGQIPVLSFSHVPCQALSACVLAHLSIVITMSTSSGRKGWCTRCGHGMNEHARSAESKCRMCKKAFEICQTSYHGQEGYSPEGWRICYIPCNCGELYYPEKAKAARPLQPHEYIPGHPAYRALEEESFRTADVTGATDVSGHTDITDADDSSAVPAEANPWPNTSVTSTSNAGPSNLSHQRTFSEDSLDPLQWSPGRIGRETAAVADLAQQFDQVQLDDPISSEDPIYVDTYFSRHGRVCFIGPEGQEFKTDRSGWTPSTVDYEGQLVACFMFVGPRTGRCFYTWTLGNVTQGEGSSGGRRRRRR